MTGAALVPVTLATGALVGAGGAGIGGKIRSRTAIQPTMSTTQTTMTMTEVRSMKDYAAVVEAGAPPASSDASCVGLPLRRLISAVAGGTGSSPQSPQG